MSKTRVLLLFGGQSAEHEVSVISARSVSKAINRDQYELIPVGIARSGQWFVSENPAQLLDQDQVLADGMTAVHLVPGARRIASPDGVALAQDSFDIVFPLLHGPHGEDGSMQGLLELAGAPYVGAGVAASAVGMDKELARAVFAARGLKQTDYLVFRKQRWLHERDTILQEIERALPYPVFVKPPNLGSSIGISKAKNANALAEAIDYAARFDIKIMVERSIEKARELECAVLVNESPKASIIGEIVPGAEFYDYTTKYLDDRSKLIVPAELPDSLSVLIQEMAIGAFQAIDGAGLSRVDFLLSTDGDVYLNEINTMPGFTPISMYPRLWQASGIEYADLIDQLIRLGQQRFQDRSGSSSTRD